MNEELLKELFNQINQTLDKRLLPVEEKIQGDVVGTVYSFPKYTVAELPNISNFMVAFATNGRKSGETLGNGTGVPVYYDSSSSLWLTFYDNSEVLA